jgi:DNA-directed RNA polymerase specialized sigma24 family protein
MGTKPAKHAPSAELVRRHFSGLTREQFQDLSRRLVAYATRQLRGASLDHHAYEIVTGAMDRALDGSRRWDPGACSFECFMFGVVRSRADTLRRSPGARLVKIAAQLPLTSESSRDVLAELADQSLHAHTLPSIEAEQELERLTLSMARIDATLARILVMAIYEGRSNADIVKALQLPIRDVENGKKRLRRALQRLYAADHPARRGTRMQGGLEPGRSADHSPPITRKSTG